MKLNIKYLAFLFILCMGCSKSNKTRYLQTGEISLVQPRLTLNNSLIDSFVLLKADLKIKDVTINYTENGKTPSDTSFKYKEPIKITSPGTYTFRAFHPDWKPSKTTSISIYKKGQKPKKISWYSEENQQYKGLGKTTLINEQKASLDFNNPQWVGFDSIVNAEVIFDKLTFIKSIDIGYLTDIGSWIFPPENIELILYNKTKDIDKIELQIEQPKCIEERGMKNINVTINQNITSIQLKIKNLQSIPNWHEGKGTKAWLFMDEWIFN